MRDIYVPLFFEDFHVGRVFELGDHDVTLDAVVSFARQFDPQPFHLDEVAAGETSYGGIIASGWHMGSVLMRLMVDGMLHDAASLGSPGIEELQWAKPVYPGDTVNGRCTVEQARESRSRPTMGLVLFLCQLRNQHDKTVVSMRSWGMLGRDPSAST
jgi:acyl dehydratase